MTAVLAATTLFRDRDLFVHDGSKLRRFRVSAPVQAFLFIVLLALVGWASFLTAQLFTGHGGRISAATEARARMIEQRQALIEAALSGQKLDPAMIEAAAAGGRLAKDGPLARVDDVRPCGFAGQRLARRVGQNRGAKAHGWRRVGRLRIGFA